MSAYVVQLSGGLDSAACLLWALEKGHKVDPVFYTYGQPYLNMEYRAARKLTDHLKLPLSIWPVDMITKDIYVPYRNLILTAHSLHIAASNKMDGVVVGSCQADIYVDGSMEFFIRLRSLIDFITEEGNVSPEIILPIHTWSKAQVVKFIVDAGYNPDELWTCYGIGPKPCGTCSHCLKYAEAKRELGMT